MFEIYVQIKLNKISSVTNRDSEIEQETQNVPKYKIETEGVIQKAV